MYFSVPNEKQKGDEKIIRSHLEDIILDMRIGIVVSNYFIGDDGNELEAWLEPFQYIDHPLEYYIMLDGKSKREINWTKISHEGFSSTYIKPKSIFGNKYTLLHVRPQKRLKGNDLDRR